VPIAYRPNQRWRLLVPEGAVVVRTGPRRIAINNIRALPAGTIVALAGRRGLRGIARRTGLRVAAEYVALPSLATPVAITQVSRQPLCWTSRAILTVPSGVTRLHAPLWAAVRVVRAMPSLLPWIPAGERLMIGTRS
jgi:hypothetical protein